MERYMKIAAALCVLLFVLEVLVPATTVLLPLGGTQETQLAIMFGGAYGLYELIQAIRRTPL